MLQPTENFHVGYVVSGDSGEQSLAWECVRNRRVFLCAYFGLRLEYFHGVPVPINPAWEFPEVLQNIEIVSIFDRFIDLQDRVSQSTLATSNATTGEASHLLWLLVPS